ncbi:lactoylglutathione lyase family protein [Methanomethylovorans hollandica DSM 15978]|uniref:Lactoylglutathione lyase family protein n=1 Tax=Methanomethylovorans hollandica (strain DSM 15978 / NBRC 107637 / DMS1) TaxID=867904 RepID=L0KXJ7_METHD|nr:VOC family protein [Methanomethylovorans hollandica]AGB49415.1 lactoylglutathione lyase family protein [Methanomethylovorans hollandica DSM 15978]
MPTIVHLDIPADDPERASKFYSRLFDWNIELNPEFEYYMVHTQGLDGTDGPGGGIGKRQGDQKITAYIGVPSVDEYITKVESLGGKTVAPKIAVPGMGYLAVCLDTENNTFGLWEDNADAK